MKAARFVLMAAGLAMGVWGLWLMRDFRFEQLSSAVVWLAAGVVAHDFILAPIVIGVGVFIARVCPADVRKAVMVSLIVWGTVTIAVANVLSGQGGKPDNDSILDRPYVVTWVALSGLLVAGLAALIGVRRSRAAIALRHSRKSPDSA